MKRFKREQSVHRNPGGMGNRSGKKDKDELKNSKTQKEEKVEEEEKGINVVLLGIAEAGKSTIYNQLLHIFGEGFNENTRINMKHVIHANIATCVPILIQEAIDREEEAKAQAREVEPEFAMSERAKASMRKLHELHLQPGVELTPSLANDIKIVWEDPGFKNAFEKRKSDFIQTDDGVAADSTRYFLDKLDIISSENYIVTDEDILRPRVKTTGIIKGDFQIENCKMCVYDVGGRRNERKKWIHCFENVGALIFVAALDEYDQVCGEDLSANKLAESLRCFEEHVRLNWFANSKIFVFFTKKDLFEKKLTKIPLNQVFTDWTGETKEQAYEFIENKYREKISGIPHMEVYFLTMNATNSEEMHKIFLHVKEIIMPLQYSENLLDS
jgi:guanine nucleotide-binding protein G(i) subunit alpha